MPRCCKSYGSRISFESAGAGLSSFPLSVCFVPVRASVRPSVRSIDRSIGEFHSFSWHVRAARTLFPVARLVFCLMFQLASPASSAPAADAAASVNRAWCAVLPNLIFYFWKKIPRMYEDIHTRAIV